MKSAEAGGATGANGVQVYMLDQIHIGAWDGVSSWMDC